MLISSNYLGGESFHAFHEGYRGRKVLFYHPGVCGLELIKDRRKAEKFYLIFSCVHECLQKENDRDLPGSPAVKTLHFYRRGAGSIPDQESKRSHALGCGR